MRGLVRHGAVSSGSWLARNPPDSGVCPFPPSGPRHRPASEQKPTTVQPSCPALGRGRASALPLRLAIAAACRFESVATGGPSTRYLALHGVFSFASDRSRLRKIHGRSDSTLQASFDPRRNDIGSGRGATAHIGDKVAGSPKQDTKTEKEAGGIPTTPAAAVASTLLAEMDGFPVTGCLSETGTIGKRGVPAKTASCFCRRRRATISIPVLNLATGPG